MLSFNHLINFVAKNIEKENGNNNAKPMTIDTPNGQMVIKYLYKHYMFLKYFDIIYF